MNLIVDTREQKWGHVRAYFEEHGLQFENRKLDFGDYMVPGGTVSVDRKQNLDELAQNLCTADSRRFWNEIRGASKAGIHLVVLCEHGGKVRTIRDVKTWKSCYTKITGEMIFRKMFMASAAYGVEFRFCNKGETGARIAEILGGEDNGRQ